MPDIGSPSGVTLGARIGVTDQYLRVWRLLFFQQENAAHILGQTSDTAALAPGEAATQIPGQKQIEVQNQVEIAQQGAIEDILSSEVPTGQYPTMANQAAGLRVHFMVTLGVTPTPNTAEITIYNLSDEKVMRIIREYNYVVLQAGYEYGYAGTIFTGSIMMYKKGHENATDSYVKIYAADGELAINQATINTSFPPGTDAQTYHDGLVNTLKSNYNIASGEVDPTSIIIPPNARTATVTGMTADHLRDFHGNNGSQWNIYNQTYHFGKPTTYDPGVVLDINSKTGLVGWPEVTQDGLNFTMLINPALQLRSRVHLDNKQINQYFTPGGSSGAQYSVAGSEPQLYYPVAFDGMYTPVSINFEGDSRSGPWYMYVIAFAIDATSSPDACVTAGKYLNTLTP